MNSTMRFFWSWQGHCSVYAVFFRPFHSFPFNCGFIMRIMNSCLKGGDNPGTQIGEQAVDSRIETVTRYQTLQREIPLTYLSTEAQTSELS